ncbi:uncharacterized protein LOC108909826 [Anoplophora glabripennis]|uniref:uncharacterized protein LOC108909826 n=1 Tax=Anoplophora glabripennis TaxID=217634 RepID=UPI000874E78B|nr:uncharacterized protein LOC108909826 [Anoplophora glabripennis]
MSHEGSSHSESSSSSPGQTPFFQEHFIRDSNQDITDLTLFGCPAPTFVRTGTVRRVRSSSLKKEKELNCIAISNEDTDNNIIVTKTQEQVVNSRYRRSLDSSFRHSLDSISEHKTRRSFSPTSLLNTTSRECSSLDSSSSEHTDNALRSLSDNVMEEKDKTIQSPNSSYLTWIESVNSEYFGSAVSAAEVDNVDNKVGEWNNFWLNYNNARGRYLSSPYLNGDERMADDGSEVKSTCSTHRDLTDKNSGEYISLTLDEIHETVRCAQRITEILQNALRRNDQDIENLNMENSYYSESFSRQNSSVKEDYREITKEDIRNVARERSMSYAVTSAELLKQKELLKPAVQSSSTSCINALLNTGVADILKRVINKRRDVISPDSMPSATRSSFSEWSGK